MGLFNVYPLYDIEIERAKDLYLWDRENRNYLDMYGGHAVISIGHSADRYISAISEQLNKIGFYSNSVIIPQQRVLAEKLGKLSGKESYNLFLCNSGAEANENAIKLASMHNSKRKVIAFSGSFHGRTSLAVAATDNKSIVAPVNETENVIILPYNDVACLEKEFAKGGVSSVIVEAIQGVGGIQIATKEFLQAIRSLCDQYDAVMIADCVQCGCARSGRYFAMDHSNVNADIYSMAKGIGNGFPIGAILISDKIEAKFGMLGTTFGGNHLACAAAIAVVDEILERNLVKNAEVMGNYLLKELREINCDQILEIRGVGLMIGIVFREDSAPIRKRLLEEEFIFVGSAKDSRIVRLLPSLTISKDLCDLFLDAFKRVLAV